ncbi:MAG: EF-hand domain-containing protein, partial [Alphaproteobacteria bacterium]|nr:EF-hand domain-containing protein [Alphaproteobacteria bacterium]
QGGGMGLPRALADVPAWADRLFDRLDANQDGAVTGDELAVLSRGPVGAMGGSRLRRMIGQSDASNDGRISREEMTAGAQRMFNRMDADGDGVLSDTERPRPPARPASPAMPMPAAEPEPMPFPDMAGGAA